MGQAVRERKGPFILWLKGPLRNCSNLMPLHGLQSAHAVRGPSSAIERALRVGGVGDVALDEEELQGARRGGGGDPFHRGVAEMTVGARLRQRSFCL